MKTHMSVIRAAALWPLLCLASLSGQTTVSDPSAPVVKLPAFDVASRPDADPYRSTDTLSVNRVAGNVLDSPFTVNVATSELLQDLGANSAYDVTRYFSGISSGRGTGAGGIQDRQDFRGFESFSKTIDNFSSFLLPTGSGFQATFDPEFIDRVELVMGPDSILSPTGSPGGSLNMVTKSPKLVRGTDVTVELGNYNAEKLTLDTTGPIGSGGHWAYRLIGSVQDAQTYVPSRLKQFNGSVQLMYVISPTAKITFKYFGEQWGLYGAIANTNDNNEQVYTPNTLGGATLSTTPQPGFVYQGNNGSASWSTRIDRLNIGEMELTTALGSRVNMRFGAEVLFDHVGQDLAFPKNAPAETFDPTTGQVIAVAPINPASVPEVGQLSAAQNREIQLQNDYAANFQDGPVSLQPVVGWASQQGREGYNYILTDSNTADFPPANLFAGAYGPPLPPVANYTFSTNLPEQANLFQAYGVVRAGFFSDHLFLTAGVSRLWATVNDYSFKGMFIPGVGQVGAAPSSPGYLQDFTLNNTGNVLAPVQNNQRDTYIEGVLVKLTDHLSLYGSSSTNAGIAASNPLWQAGKQVEFGAKAEFLDQRLQLTAAHFQITQSNVSSQNPLFNTGQSTVPFLLTNEKNHGEEFNLAGGLTPHLSVIASYTEMRLRDPLGRRLRNVPDHLSNLLLNYHFTEGLLKNLNVFAGANHQGNVSGESISAVSALGVPEQPSFYVNAFTVLNVGAGYGYGRYHFNLNVDNALNQKFWWQPASRISVSPYPGATFRFTTTIHL
jgi:iron complex outermembrane receptor protein